MAEITKIIILTFYVMAFVTSLSLTEEFETCIFKPTRETEAYCREVFKIGERILLSSEYYKTITEWEALFEKSSSLLEMYPFDLDNLWKKIPPGEILFSVDEFQRIQEDMFDSIIKGIDDGSSSEDDGVLGKALNAVDSIFKEDYHTWREHFKTYPAAIKLYKIPTDLVATAGGGVTSQDLEKLSQDMARHIVVETLAELERRRTVMYKSLLEELEERFKYMAHAGRETSGDLRERMRRSLEKIRLLDMLSKIR